MVVHLLTCLTLTMLTSYVVALKLFALKPAHVAADGQPDRVMAPAR